MPTETQLVARIMLMLEQHGAYVNKNHGSPFQRMGRPDIEGCLHGLFFAFEVKLPRKLGTVTPLQRRALREIQVAGGCAAAVEGVEGAKNMLRSWGLIGA